MILRKRHQWCEKHWSPIRDNRQINGVLASILVMQAFVQDERVMKYCGAAEGKPAKTEKLNKAVRHFSPLCCFLGEEKMAEIVAEATTKQ